MDHFGLESLAALPGIDDLKAAGLLDRRQGLTSIAMQEIEEGDEGYEEQMDGQESLFPLDPESEDPDVDVESAGYIDGDTDTGADTGDDIDDDRH